MGRRHNEAPRHPWKNQVGLAVPEKLLLLSNILGAPQFSYWKHSLLYLHSFSDSVSQLLYRTYIEE